jgi:hypothetical protein
VLISKRFLRVLNKATPVIRRQGYDRVSSYRACSIFHIVTCTIGAKTVGRNIVGSLVLLDEMWRPASVLREEDRRGQCSRGGDGLL